MLKGLPFRGFAIVFALFVLPDFIWGNVSEYNRVDSGGMILEMPDSYGGDFSENLFYQDVPLFIGEKEFNTKLDKIRTEEKREPLGLILSGGSARAYAHIGVLKKLEEEGLVPDFIVANSMGAIVGILYSAGFSPDTMETLLSNVNLNNFFSLLGITNGGLLSNRYFISALNMLLQGGFDLENCEIPLVIVAEDLYSKRQVWFSKGDLAKVTAAACSMSFMIEPVEFSIQDDDGVIRDLRLVDAGTIDLGSVGVAGNFSSNLIMSSAFYDKDLNLKNPIVILNRSFAIGKERKTVKDLKEFEPFLIRNNVEKYSFMDFSKIEEIAYQGYYSAETALNSLSLFEEECLAFFDLSAKKRWKNTSLREKRNGQVENFCSLMKLGYTVRAPESYFGTNLKLRRKMSGFPFLQLMDFGGISLSIFSDNPYFSIGGEVDAGVFTPAFAGSLGFSFFPSKVSTLAFLFRMSGVFDGADLLPDSIYSASYFSTQIPVYKTLGLNVSFLPYFSAEYISDYSFKNFETLFQTGGQFYITGEKKAFYDSIKRSGKKWQFDLRVMPGLYYGFDQNLLQEVSGGGNVYFVGKTPFFTGLIISGTGRASFTGVPLSVFPTTDFPGFIPEGKSLFAGSGYTRLFFYISDPALTFAETFKIEEFSAGGFCSGIYSGEGSVAAGVFLEIACSISGLSSMRFTTGLGQDFGTDSLCWFFSLNDGW